jgi:hypothetical protein
MKTKRFNTLQLIPYLGLVALIYFASLQAQAGIICETAFGEKTITIQDNQVSIVRGDSGREIASLQKARSDVHVQGFSRVLYVEGQKHKVFIRNAANFSDVNDYLKITNPKGHEMTYPLSCHQA